MLRFFQQLSSRKSLFSRYPRAIHHRSGRLADWIRRPAESSGKRALEARLKVELLETRTMPANVINYPVEWNNFENNLADASGNGNSLSPLGNSNYSFGQGVIGQAVYLNNGALQRSSNGATGPNGEISISVWVDTTGSNAGIVTLENGTSDVFGVDLNGTQAQILYNGTTINTQSVLADGKWHHIGLIFNNTHAGTDNGSISLYVDATLIYSNAADLAPLNAYNQVVVGQSNDAANELQGAVDMFGLYTAALAPEDVSRLWNNANGYDPTIPQAVSSAYANVPANQTFNVSAPGVLQNDFDPPGDPLTASLVSTTSHGSLTLNSDGSFSYTPNNGFIGTDSFIYRAYDGGEYSAPVSVTLQVGTTAMTSATYVGVAPGVNLDNQTLSAAVDLWYRFHLVRLDSVTIDFAITSTTGNPTPTVSVFDIVNGQSNLLSSATGNASGVQDSVSNLNPGDYYLQFTGVPVGMTFNLTITPGPGSGTVVYYVNDSSTVGDTYTTAPGADLPFYGTDPAHPKASVQSLLNEYSVIGPNSLVLIDTGTYNTGTVVTGPVEGAAYADGANGSTFTAQTAFNLSDSDGNLFYGMYFSNNSYGFLAQSGGSGMNSRRNTFLNNTFTGDGTAIEIDSGEQDVIQYNVISNGGSNSYGINVPGENVNGTGYISQNTITGVTTGIAGYGVLQIYNNTIAADGTGISIGSGSDGSYVYNNTITTNTTSGTGANIGSANVSFHTNSVSDSSLGLYEAGGDQIYGNSIFSNGTGIQGYGIIGPSSWDVGQPNSVYDNTTGIVSLGGDTIRFNFIDNNTTGIVAASNDTIINDLLYRNSGDAVDIFNDNTVTVTNVTIYTPSGNGVVLGQSSQNVSLSNNILWTNSGYDLYVANNSQQGFASDYNNLYTTNPGDPTQTAGTAALVWWQKSFVDLFDWQVEAGFDIHSIGYTALSPNLDNPHFANLAGDDYHLNNGSTSIDAGNPATPIGPEPADPGVPRARIDLGGYGGTAQASQPPSPYIRIDFPNFYTDWEYDVGHAIMWHSYQVSGDVSISVYNVANPLQPIYIGTTAVSAGTYTWTPEYSNISPDSSQRYRIVLTSVNNTAVDTQSREPFAVPSAGDNFYVNDGSTVGDEYTTAVGSNRNTGKNPWDPKATVRPILANYTLTPGDTVWIDTGYYNIVQNIVISGDHVHGDTQGAAFIGAQHHATILDRDNTNAGTIDVDINDSNSISMSYLNFVGAQTGLLVRNNSNYFTGSYLTAYNNAGDGILIQSGADQTTVTYLTAYDNGGNGVDIETPITNLVHSLAYGNGGTGLYLANAGSVLVQYDVTYNNGGDGTDVGGSGNGQILNDTSYDNRGTGISVDSFQTAIVNNDLAYGNGANGFALEGIGNATVDNDLSYSNGADGFTAPSVNASLDNDIAHSNGGDGFAFGAYSNVASMLDSQSYSNDGNGVTLILSGGTVGVTTLSTDPTAPAHGNLIYDNHGDGVYANAGLIAGNNIYGNGQDGIYLAGGEALLNDVYLNGAEGISTDPQYGGSVFSNRVYANASTGVHLYTGSPATNNVIYNNSIGIIAEPGDGTNDSTIANNLIYANGDQGIIIHSGYHDFVTNNTVYELSGDALDVDNSTRYISIRNNILWTQLGYDLNVDSSSQVGFDSDYNDLYITGAAQTAFWQGISFQTLFDWQYADFVDQNSFNFDPLFVIATGPDGHLGYYNSSSDGRDDDFHPQSRNASDHGGSPAPAISSTTNLPNLLAGTWPADPNQAPAIDRGDFASDFSLEPAPNGGYINVGYDGNTPQASLSLASYVLVMHPTGEETWEASQNYHIAWRTVLQGENALSFNGTSEYVSVPDSTGSALQVSSLTLEGWFRFNAAPTGTEVLVSKGAGNSSQSYELWYDGTNLHGVVGTPFSVGTAVQLAWPPTVGEWYHLAFTFDPSSGDEMLYIYGVNPGNYTVTNLTSQPTNANVSAIGYDSTNPQPLVIGAAVPQGGAAGSFFNGMADNVRLWNSVLDANTITAQMFTTPVGQLSNTGTLAAYYQFNNTSGTTISDTMGNAPGYTRRLDDRTQSLGSVHGSGSVFRDPANRGQQSRFLADRYSFDAQHRRVPLDDPGRLEPGQRLPSQDHPPRYVAAEPSPRG